MTRRRRRPTPEERCSREGCRRRKGAGFQHCGHICRLIDLELAKAQRVCTAVGASPATTELWTAAVELSDSYTRLVQIHARLKTGALREGMTERQWAVLVSGDTVG